MYIHMYMYNGIKCRLMNEALAAAAAYSYVNASAACRSFITFTDNISLYIQ